MSQLYARVFVQILESSIAEDYVSRHIFEDFFKLCDSRTGVVDMTREAISRRLNIPMNVLGPAIDKLESPDASSRDPEFEGRRLKRLDEHRNWGWMILNWPKYALLKKRADVSDRVSRHRQNETEKSIFVRPTLDEVKECCAKCGLPELDAVWFWNKCEANEWTNGGRPIKSWQHTIASWKAAGYMPSQKSAIKSGQSVKSNNSRNL